MTWSSIWLSRFEMGPFEWAWRCLTYGRLVPFLKLGRAPLNLNYSDVSAMDRV
ncbi:DUF418 domain-containing protein [Granulicella sp. S156]|uniref:DUF418 domain-containing protein n=1 Tax=Granulicella sp. S156 TaxID=1747224 RepID=UPI00131DB36D